MSQEPSEDLMKLGKIIKHLSDLGLTFSNTRIHEQNVYAAMLPKHQVEWLRSYAIIHNCVNMPEMNVRLFPENAYVCEIVFSMRDWQVTLPTPDPDSQIPDKPKPISSPYVSPDKQN